MTKLKEILKANWLILLIWLIAFTIRVFVAIFSKGYIHPDEHYQSIEVAYDTVFGLGRIPWEFEDGIRSWFYPGIVVVIFKSLKFIGITDINSLIIGVRLFSTFCSMITVIVTYFFAKKLFDKRVGIIATVFVSFWHDFIFWSARTIGDSIAMNFIFLGCYLTFLCFPNRNEEVSEAKLSTQKFVLRSLFAGISFGIAFMLKFSSVVIIIPLIIWLLVYKKWKEVLILIGGLGILVIVQGVIDHFTWGSFLHAPIEFVKFNILEGQSVKFGISPFISYIALIFDAYSEYFLIFLMFIIIGSKCTKKHSILLTTFFFYFLVFSFISHKEYRFILPIMPILVLFAAKGFAVYPNRIKKGSIKKPIFVTMVLVTIAFSCVNSFYLKTFQPRNQGCLAMEWIGQQSDCEIVMLIDGASFNLPGYAYLQTNVLIDFSHPEYINFYTNLYRNNHTYYLIPEEQYLKHYELCNSSFSAYNISNVKSFIGTHYFYDKTMLIFKNNIL
ncbi:MAG: phospholipid carrier-dependent glycosyltransferase [Asgard group archaeon]|nr:phospholipid carrier-dependent glycosyltransferase [Asgard group archaeon]